MKIKIKNNTIYNNKDLKRLFNECVRRHGDLRHSDTLAVVISYSKRNRQRILGHTRLNSNWMELYVKKPNWIKKYNDEIRKAQVRGYWLSMTLADENQPLVNTASLAGCFVHEMNHCRGIKHKEMIHRDIISEGFEWAKDYNISIKEKKQIVKPDIKEIR